MDLMFTLNNSLVSHKRNKISSAEQSSSKLVTPTVHGNDANPINCPQLITILI